MPYKIQTNDGKIYSAKLTKENDFGSKDLALLQFASPKQYQLGSIGTLPILGDEVFAAGFPAIQEDEEKLKFLLTTGKIALILPKSLDDGYQIGYTNNIESGMSGGALLNRQGELIGINGKQSYPALDVPSRFSDGSNVSADVHQQISRLSWAIPIETIVLKLKVSNNSIIDRKSPTHK